MASTTISTAIQSAPLEYDLKKVQDWCAQASIKAALEMIKTFQSQGKQTHQALAQSLQDRATPLVAIKNTDQKVQMVYNLVFYATMENVEKGIAEKFMIDHITSVGERLKIPAALLETQKAKVEGARIKPNLENIKLAGVELLKTFVAAHVIPEAIVLVGKLGKEQPTALDAKNLWNVSDANIDKYREYNIG